MDGDIHGEGGAGMRYDDGNRHAVPIDGGWFAWIDDGSVMLDGMFGTYEEVMAWLGWRKESESVRHMFVSLRDGSGTDCYGVIGEDGDVTLFPPVFGMWVTIPHEDIESVRILEG